MLDNQKQAFRSYCKAHKHLYRIFSRWFERRTNRALRENRRLWGIDNNLVVFSSYNMQSYNDNPKYICEALHWMRPQTFMVWLFRDVEAARAKYAIPSYVRCVEWKTPMANFFLGRARVIVDNWQKPDWLRLGRNQIYLFSPHHDRSLKSGGFLKKDRLYNRLVESRASIIWTLSPSKHWRNIFPIIPPIFLPCCPAKPAGLLRTSSSNSEWKELRFFSETRLSPLKRLPP